MSIHVNEHPDLEQLKIYLGNIEADEFSSIRLHLASCPDCRDLVDGLIGLQTIATHDFTDNLSSQQHELISNYVNGFSSTADNQSSKEFIDNNPQALKAALHYASQQSAIKKQYSAETSTSNVSPAANHSRAGFLDNILSTFSFYTPAWVSIPAAVAFIALISVNLMHTYTSTVQHTIVSYQDNPVIQFRSKEQIPGIGFFAQNEVISRNYDGLDVSVSPEGQFTLRWPAINNAIRYELKLHIFDNGNKLSVAEVTTETNVVIFQSNIQNLNHRYEWQLTGETSDHQLFKANGGFVITGIHRGSSQ